MSSIYGDRNAANFYRDYQPPSGDYSHRHSGSIYNIDARLGDQPDLRCVPVEEQPLRRVASEGSVSTVSEHYAARYGDLIPQPIGDGVRGNLASLQEALDASRATYDAATSSRQRITDQNLIALSNSFETLPVISLRKCRFDHETKDCIMANTLYEAENDAYLLKDPVVIETKKQFDHETKDCIMANTLYEAENDAYLLKDPVVIETKKQLGSGENTQRKRSHFALIDLEDLVKCLHTKKVHPTLNIPLQPEDLLQSNHPKFALHKIIRQQ